MKKPKAKADLTMNLSGDEELLSKILYFRDEKTAVLKKAARAATAPLKKAVKALAPKRENKYRWDKDRSRTIAHSVWGGPKDDRDRELWQLHKTDPTFRGQKNANAFLVVGKTGGLRKSVDVKIHMGKKKVTATATSTGRTIYRSKSSNRVVGIVGHKHAKVVAYNPFTKKLVLSDPARYAHLVEGGFVLKIRGKRVGRIKARPYIVPAYEGTIAQAQAAARQVLRQELERLLTNNRKIHPDLRMRSF